jgi:histidinol dehydrogenase
MLNIFRACDPDSEEKVRQLVDRASIERDVEPQVRAILDAVRERGDAALLEFTRRFDRVDLTADRLRVDDDERIAAAGAIEPRVKAALLAAKARIEAFHGHEKRPSWEADPEAGVRFGQVFRPLDAIGIYVPGGETDYPSTVLMNAIPAAVAGVRRVVLVTPPGGSRGVSPHVLFAASCCGVTEIYRVGGAQAIGALAYGTETIPKVDKIVGPGNVFVNVAKRLVFGAVGIDGLAGPSEVVILADKGADPVLVAADLLSQAEHDPLATAVLVTPSGSLAEAVVEEIERQIRSLSRAVVIAGALRERGAVLVVESLDEGIDLVNRLAPEHLEVMVERIDDAIPRLRNAGMILVGEGSPVAFCDYGAGPTHVLPTGGAARFSAPLSVGDCLNHTNYLAVSGAARRCLAESLEPLAEIEGFSAHAAAMRLRKESRNG